MRINVYAEELTHQVELRQKTVGDEPHVQSLMGLRFWLHLPVTLPDGKQIAGPFMHHKGDDDSSAVTLWGSVSKLRAVISEAQRALDLIVDDTEFPGC